MLWNLIFCIPVPYSSRAKRLYRMCCVVLSERPLRPKAAKSAALQNAETAFGGSLTLLRLGRPPKPAQFHSENYPHSLVCGRSARHSAGRPAYVNVAPRLVSRPGYATAGEGCCDIQTVPLRSVAAASCAKVQPHSCYVG